MDLPSLTLDGLAALTVSELEALTLEPAGPAGPAGQGGLLGGTVFFALLGG